MRTQTMFRAMGAVLVGLPLLSGCPSEQSKSGQAAAPKGQTAAPKTPASSPAGAASQGAASKAAPHAKISAGKPGEPFSGLVKLGEGLTEADIKPTDVLFVMARESKGKNLAGRLVAVQRHGKLKFPKRYQLSAKDVMVPGIPFKGPFIVTARLDRDGDPMTKTQDDLYATVATPVVAGQEGAHLILKKGGLKFGKPPPGAKVPGMAPSNTHKRPASSQPARPTSRPKR